MFDLRFLPNPYYVEHLRSLTGNAILEVSDYVLSFDESNAYLSHIKHMLDFVIPHMIRDGRTQLVIGIGCTGGQHRSVTFANALSKHYKSKGFQYGSAIHRNVRKEG